MSATSAVPTEQRDGRGRVLLLNLAELAALTGFAVAQPLLDTFGRSPESFIAVDASTADIVLFGLAVVLVPLAVLAVVEAVAQAVSRRVLAIVHLVLVGGLVAVILVQVAKRQTTWPGRAVIVFAVLGTVAAVAAFRRFAVARSWLRFAAIAPVLFLVLFLVASPTAELFSGETGDAADVEVRRPAPVVVIAFDEFPTGSLLDGDGQIDAELFPNLAALAQDATWYRNATTVSPTTVESVPSIFTGQEPDRSERSLPPTASTFPENLFTLLGATYTLNVHEWVTSLCELPNCRDAPLAQSALRALLDDAADVWREDAWPRNPQDTAPESEGPSSVDADDLLGGFERPELVQQFVDSITGEQRSLDVLHVALPHGDWVHLPDGRSYDAPPSRSRRTLSFGRWPDQAGADAARLRHLLQVQYADHFIGQLVARLRELDRYESSMIVVVADHGVAFEPEVSNRTITEDNIADIAWVPFFVKYPGARPARIDDSNVLTIDAVPTIADTLGVDIPWDVDGVIAGTRDDEAKWVDNSDQVALDVQDGRAVIPPDEFASVLATPAAGRGDGPLRLWRAGQWGGLVGRPARPFVNGAPVRSDGTVDVPDGLRDLHLDRDQLPIYVSGNASDLAGRDVVVAVNGRVAGADRVEPRASALGDFGVLLPPPLLHAGDNRVTVYVVDGDADAPVLHELS